MLGVCVRRGRHLPQWGLGVQSRGESLGANSCFLALSVRKLTHVKVQNTTFPFQAVLCAPSTGQH